MKYWSIPLLFSVLFPVSGYILFIFEPVITLYINGHPMILLPPNFQYFYNTRTGPITSIFLSNFIYDGIGNAVILGMFSILFISDNFLIEERERKGRAYFLIGGSLSSGFISSAGMRFLMSYQVGYGQSAVVSGFIGIVLFFVLYDLIHGKLFSRAREVYKEKPIKLGILFIVYCIAIAEVISGVLVLSLGLPPLTIIIHLMAMTAGIILAGAYTFLTREEKPEGTVFLKGEEINGEG
ncbi:MAG: hypothetical protein QXP36_04900 [Conexivisphaerales archaeon]